MSQQIIVSIGRQFGSGGLEIATRLAAELGLALYDRNLLSQLAAQHQISPRILDRYDEEPKNKLISRSVRGISNAPQDHVAQMEFDYLKDLARQGQSFVIVGRCGEEVLREYSCLISIFIRADRGFRQGRLVEQGRADNYQYADKLIARIDRSRRTYHNQHCSRKWGHAETYDLVIDSSRLSIPGTVSVLKSYVSARTAFPAPPVP